MHQADARTKDTTTLTVVPIETPTLGDRSYLVHDGEVAFVVDPQRDIDRVLRLLDEHDVRLTRVLESHVHNDYVTGGLTLARRTGAAYFLNGSDDVAFDRVPVEDGQTISVGDRMLLTALATPGHTFTHLSYALREVETAGDVAVFTGGSLLYGATGRPDLLGAEHTEELARLQHRSAQRLADALPDAADLYPTHGFGSFCAASQSEASESTIGNEKRSNPVLTQDEDTYAREVIELLGAYPAYYAHMMPLNSTGPSEPEYATPQRLEPAELRRRVHAGEWVVDLRPRDQFAARHLPGSLNVGLDGNMATYLGWLMPWGTPLTLLAETADDLLEAQRELSRIGIDRPATATADLQQWSDQAAAAFTTSTLDELAAVVAERRVTVLDVRRAEEFAAAHIEGALNVPLHDLPTRVGEIPDAEIWVHCESGYRSSIAASLLDAAGHQVVAVDDDFSHARQVGLPLVGPEA